MVPCPVPEKRFFFVHREAHSSMYRAPARENDLAEFVSKSLCRTVKNRLMQTHFSRTECSHFRYVRFPCMVCCLLSLSRSLHISPGAYSYLVRGSFRGSSGLRHMGSIDHMVTSNHWRFASHVQRQLLVKPQKQQPQGYLPP